MQDRCSVRLKRCTGTSEEEELKENIANELLSNVGYPRNTASSQPRAYSEQGLARKTAGRCVVRLDEQVGSLYTERPSQTWFDEMKFMIRLTPLSPRHRYFLRGWMLGWTQQESAQRWLEALGYDGRINAGKTLHEAMEMCHDSSNATYSTMSRHTIYRRPSHRRDTWKMTTCRYCKEPFVRGFGSGNYCSTGCRCAASITT